MIFSFHYLQLEIQVPLEKSISEHALFRNTNIMKRD